MIARFRSWWQKVKKPLEVAVIVVVCVSVIALLVIIVLTYLFNVNEPGLRGKNLWDWLQLLIIPAVLAIGGYLFNYTTSRTEREIASGRQQEEALQAYIDSMSELLLHESLRQSGGDDEVSNIARVRTLTVLPRLDGNRKASVLKFLVESKLTVRDMREDGSVGYTSIISLYNADLREANLSEAYLLLANLSTVDLRRANLSRADLEGANLEKANLGEADLSDATLVLVNLSDANLQGAILDGANLSGADLDGANLSKADLSKANLRGANLTGAIITTEQLDKAKSLTGAKMPDGSTHP